MSLLELFFSFCVTFLEHFVVVVILESFSKVILKFPQVGLEIASRPLSGVELHRKFRLLFDHLLLVFSLLHSQLLVLIFHNGNLSSQDELLALDFERLLLEFLLSAVELSPHQRILSLEQLDVLVRGLVVVVQTANA